MRVTIKRKEFDSLDNSEFIWACIEPVVQLVRGKDPTLKLQLYVQLTPGQQALFIFQVLYGHTRNGIAQFYGYIDYLIGKLDIWSALRVGMRYFGDDAMLKLLDKMEDVYHVFSAINLQAGVKGPGVIFENDGDYSELLTSINQIDEIYNNIIPETINRICICIRDNPEEFISIED